MKLSSAATAASIPDLNLLQDFTMVFLARDPITSLISEIKYLVLWSNFLRPLIHRRPAQNSPQGCSKGSWETRSPSYTSLWGSSWANPASSCCCGQGCRPCWKMQWRFSAIWSILGQHLSQVVLEMLMSCERDLIDLSVSLGMSSSRLATQTVPSESLVLLS